jgi:hypothetical protein
MPSTKSARTSPVPAIAQVRQTHKTVTVPALFIEAHQALTKSNPYAAKYDTQRDQHDPNRRRYSFVMNMIQKGSVAQPADSGRATRFIAM